MWPASSGNNSAVRGKTPAALAQTLWFSSYVSTQFVALCMQFPTVRRLGGSVTISCDWATSLHPPTPPPHPNAVFVAVTSSQSASVLEIKWHFCQMLPIPPSFTSILSCHSLYSSNGSFTASPCLSSIFTPSTLSLAQSASPLSPSGRPAWDRCRLRSLLLIWRQRDCACAAQRRWNDYIG